LLEHDLLLAVEEETQPLNVATVSFPVDPQVAGRSALIDRRQQAWPEPPPAHVVLLDIEGASAELEDPLQDLDRPAQALGPGKWAVELDARVLGFAGEVDPRKILAGGDLEIGEALVVFEVVVVLRLDVLDQPSFHQEGINLAVRLQMVDIGHLLDPVADSPVLDRGFMEIGAGPRAEVLGLADVDDSPLGVLHEVQARGGGEAFYLVGREDGRRRLRFRHQCLAGSDPSWCFERHVAKRAPATIAIRSSRFVQPGLARALVTYSSISRVIRSSRLAVWALASASSAGPFTSVRAKR